MYDDFENSVEPWTNSVFTGPQLSLAEWGADKTAHSLHFIPEEMQGIIPTQRALPSPVNPTYVSLWFYRMDANAVILGIGDDDFLSTVDFWFTNNSLLYVNGAGETVALNYPTNLGWVHVELVDMDWLGGQMTLRLNSVDIEKVDFQPGTEPATFVSLNAQGGRILVDEIKLR